MIPFCQVLTSPIESQASLCGWNVRPLRLNEFWLNYYKLLPRNCLNKRFSSGQLCRRQIIQKAIFPGGNYLLGNCKEAKIWRQSSRG